MDARDFFRDEWPAMAARIRGTLARRGVAAEDRDDILQETAFRLYRAWSVVDQERGVEPYARTIATNVWRGQARRAVPDEVLGDVPESAAALDSVERTCLARDELRLVRWAMDRLRPEQQVLLRDVAAEELGAATLPAVTPDAVRMARMRARKQLRAIVEAASAVAAVATWLRRLGPRRPAVAAAIVPVAFVAGALLFAPHATVPTERFVTPGNDDRVASERRIAPPRAERPAPAPHRVSAPTPRVVAAATRPTATEPNYYRVEAGNVGAGVHFDIAVMGQRVEIGRQPSGLPACADLDVSTPADPAACAGD